MGQWATGAHGVRMQGHQKIVAVCLQPDAVVVIPVLPGEEVDRDDLARSGSDHSLLVASDLARSQEGERHSDLEPIDIPTGAVSVQCNPINSQKLSVGFWSKVVLPADSTAPNTFLLDADGQKTRFLDSSSEECEKVPHSL